MKRITVLLLLAVVLFTFASLIAGATYLDRLLPGGLPFGNGLTAIGLISAAVVALILSKKESLLRWAATASVVFSILWLPVSIGLAGNLSLNFQGGRGSVWLPYSLITFVFVLISMFWAIAQSVRNRHRKKWEPE